jgi:hypothetical protein
VARAWRLGVFDPDRHLLIDHQTGLPQFVRQGVFVNFLQEAGSRSVGHDEGAANDPLGDLIIDDFYRGSSAYIGG